MVQHEHAREVVSEVRERGVTSAKDSIAVATVAANDFCVVLSPRTTIKCLLSWEIDWNRAPNYPDAASIKLPH